MAVNLKRWDGGAGGLVARGENPGLTKKVPKRYNPTASTLMVSWNGRQNTTSKEIANRRNVALYCKSLACCRIVLMRTAHDKIS